MGPTGVEKGGRLMKAVFNICPLENIDYWVHLLGLILLRGELSVRNAGIGYRYLNYYEYSLVVNCVLVKICLL